LKKQKIGLKTLPYRDGFFITIAHPEPKKVMNELTKYNLFLVSLKKGIRFAICAVSSEKCRKAPAIIKKVIDDLGSVR
jgi:aromatic-amino-acid transaminase